MNFFDTPYHLQDKQKHMAKLLDINSTQIVNIQLQAGQAIAQHHAKEHTIIIVRQGKIQFTDFPNEKALAFRLGMKVRSDKERLLWCSNYLNFSMSFYCS